MRPARASRHKDAPCEHGIQALDRSLQSMAVFVRVVEARSLTAAAQVLGTTVSAVSKCLARLERRLGARLVRRTTRSFGLTDAGRVFDGHCRRILRQVDEAELAVTQASEPPKTGRGSLRPLQSSRAQR